MKRPTWATVVGIIGLLIGSWAAFSNTLLCKKNFENRHGEQNPFAAVKKTMEDPAMQKQMQEQVKKMQEAMAKQTPPANAPPQTIAIPPSFPTPMNPGVPPQIPNPFEKMLKAPPAWMGNWQVAASALAVCLALCLVITSIGLLATKPWGVTLGYVATGGGLALAAIRAGILLSTMGVTGIALSVGLAPGFLINLIFLITIAAGDKAAFGMSAASSAGDARISATSSPKAPMESMDPTCDYSDLRKLAIIALSFAAISWIILPSGLSVFALCYGIYGAYQSIAKKTHISTFLMNAAAIAIGGASKLNQLKAAGGTFYSGTPPTIVPMTALEIVVGLWLLILIVFFIAWKKSPRMEDADLALANPLPAPREFSDKTKRAYIGMKTLYWILVVLGGWYTIRGMNYLRLLVIGGPEVVGLFIPAPYAMSMFLPSSIAQIIAWNILLKPIGQRFPDFDQYTTLKSYVTNRTLSLSKEKQQTFWNAAAQKLDLYKMARTSWATLFKFSLFSWILFGVTFIPFLFCYAKVTTNALVISPLFSFREAAVPLENLTARIDEEGVKRFGRSPRFELRGKEGSSIDLWACSGSTDFIGTDVLKIMPTLEAHHVAFEVQPVSAQAWMGTLFGEAKTTVEKIFSEAQRMAAPAVVTPSVNAPAPTSVAFGLKLLKTFHKGKNTTYIWQATSTQANGAARWRIELKLAKPNKKVPLIIAKGAFHAETGSNASELLSQLAVILQSQNASLVNVKRVVKYPFTAAILGQNLSKTSGEATIGGSFASNPPGDWMATKLFLGKKQSEVFMNLNTKTGEGEFTLKDPVYGDEVVQELATVL